LKRKEKRVVDNENNGTIPSSPPGGGDFRENLVTLIPFLRAFARTLTGHRDEADDLCQEALAKAWQARARFEPGTNMKAWVFMILRNQFYSEKRRSWRQRPWDPELADVTLVTGGAQQATVELSQVALKLRALPPEQREALVLVCAGGFGYEEAARICACPVGTIKSRISRGRKALEAALNAARAAGDTRAPKLDGMRELTDQLNRLEARTPPAGA
jgi:RNA polymerase sigma-70 factor, ECF subfamily